MGACECVCVRGRAHTICKHCTYVLCIYPSATKQNTGFVKQCQASWKKLEGFFRCSFTGRRAAPSWVIHLARDENESGWIKGIHIWIIRTTCNTFSSAQYQYYLQHAWKMYDHKGRSTKKERNRMSVCSWGGGQSKRKTIIDFTSPSLLRFSGDEIRDEISCVDLDLSVNGMKAKSTTNGSKMGVCG